ncbi:hypothetical protein KHP57_15235 [Algiphilus sp. NNCM1]|uniref:hypothetical protein n=1 Tax=Algiphilus sp. TaxID=1872431 RepID=UPI001CA68F30|nr:hypothetical protein [Algiphilus sp.]MBY8967059.1 hypothetical protein [Algiphilus acroporae]MCI5061658.1 hypothetical protein [Algiphilus sp.]MCI5102809.1 hypothetical protein [Algiphilus sp.]
MTFPSRRPSLLLLALTATVAGCSAEQPTAPAADRAAEASAAQRAYIDPETGALTVPPDTKAARSAPLGDVGDPAYGREQRADGTVMLRPKQPARHSIEGHLDADGRLHIEERDRHGD